MRLESLALGILYTVPFILAVFCGLETFIIYCTDGYWSAWAIGFLVTSIVSLIVFILGLIKLNRQLS